MSGSKVKFGVVVFPGSNCDHDAQYACGHVLHQEAELLWHKEADLKGVDVVILPGGFSYGDYLRCGAIARFSPIMKEVVRFARQGGTVLGICNGFQILLEAGLLPGVLLRNASLKFVCKFVTVKVENSGTCFSNRCGAGELLELPVAHGDGNYFTDDGTLRRLEDNGQIVFRYCDREGNITEESNPNGSRTNIAGIMNEQGNVLGMMPHPERASDPLLRHTDGQKVIGSIIDAVVMKERSLIAVEDGRR